MGPSDKIGLNIKGSENKTYILSITPTGELLIPHIGAIHISGQTISQAEIDVDIFVKKNAISVLICCYSILLLKLLIIVIF